MRANPGGVLELREIVGRDAFIERLWQILGRQSVILTAERRVGKTSIIRKMAAEEGAKLLKYQDLEAVHTPLEFVEKILEGLQPHLSLQARVKKSLNSLLKHYTGIEVGGVIRLPAVVAPHWKELLTHTLREVEQGSPDLVVFFWDELPMMLYNIRKREGEAVAMELLDVLRELRQTQPRLRMVFTGSIGLHNVLDGLKRAGYANAPVNDMHSLEVPPLELSQAAGLVESLLKGENLTKTVPRAHCESFAKELDCLPYFIHHMVDACVQTRTSPDAEGVSRLVEQALRKPDDPWQLEHYQNRIHTYYEPTDRALAFQLLDILSIASDGLTLEALRERPEFFAHQPSREDCLDMLRLLERDHYLQRQDKRWRFRFSVVERYWKYTRDLE